MLEIPIIIVENRVRYWVVWVPGFKVRERHLSEIVEAIKGVFLREEFLDDFVHVRDARGL